jgi:PAS domain S-box-containing protein
MSLYPAFLTGVALVGALSTGFILAQSPRQRATQLAALLTGSTAWWALCEAHWNAAADAASALHWMRLSTPGWAFIGGLVPHLVARYFDVSPVESSLHRRGVLMGSACLGYAVGGLGLAAAFLLDGSVHREVARVPWGWSYVPGPALLAVVGGGAGPLTLAIASSLRALRSPLSVAPPVQRAAIRIGVLTPLVLVPLTDVALPLARVPFPRLGSAAYAILGLAVLATGVRFGRSFFTPQRFSEEILDTLHEGVALITPAGVVRSANRGLVRLAGHRPGGVAGLPLRDLIGWEASEIGAHVEDRRASLRSAGGEEIPVSVSAAPLCDQRGNVLGVVVVVRDLREVEELRRDMLRQSRLAAVGELAAGLAHEINNPLAFVRSSLGQLERDWKSLGEAQGVPPRARCEIVEEGREIIGECVEGIDRATEIVRGVQRFARASREVRAPTDLNGLVDEVIAILRPRVRDGIRLEFDAGQIPQLSGRRDELRQVVLGLLVNALDAVGEAGRVAVTTRCEEERVMVEVRDDGCGIPAERLERIFDPFFTTKETGQGSGLGLAIAWRIVEAHGGRIEVDSTPQTGSAFRVRLPVEPGPR